MTEPLAQPVALALAASVLFSAAALALGFTLGFVVREVLTYLRDPRRPKPPLGWSPWSRPPAATRAWYYARYGCWRVRAACAALLVRLGVKNSW